MSYSFHLVANENISINQSLKKLLTLSTIHFPHILHHTSPYSTAPKWALMMHKYDKMSINTMKTYLTIVHSKYLFNLLCLSSPIKCIIGLAEPPELWVPWTQRDISGEILSECECAICIRSVNYLARGHHTASCYPLKCIIDKKRRLS